MTPDVEAWRVNMSGDVGSFNELEWLTVQQV